MDLHPNWWDFVGFSLVAFIEFWARWGISLNREGLGKMNRNCFSHLPTNKLKSAVFEESNHFPHSHALMERIPDCGHASITVCLIQHDMRNRCCHGYDTETEEHVILDRRSTTASVFLDGKMSQCRLSLGKTFLLLEQLLKNFL